MIIDNVHCFFEQSGTFKNEFKKMNIKAFDYDILDDFGQTDFKIDLFLEIDNAFNGLNSIFDTIFENDLIIAFFPCVRFENQILLSFSGVSFGMKNWSIEEKLKYDLKLHSELSYYYNLVTKLVLVCLSKHLRLIIENPYSSQHYLTKYWALKPSIIDKNRRLKGDFYKKPTQYYFVNCEPSTNLLFESPYFYSKCKFVVSENKVSRSLISPEYANRFIRDYILD